MASEFSPEQTGPVVPLGRAAETARILGSLLPAPPGADHDGAPRAASVLIEGEAGIGKSELWRHAVGAAERSGWRVLRTHAAAAEAALSYAGLTDLLDPMIDCVLPDLPPRQRTALEVALLRRTDDGPAVTAREVGTALCSALRRAAARQPVLIAIEDLQWLDEATAAQLAFALRRLTDVPVSTLATLRTASALSDVEDESLRRDAAARRLRDSHAGDPPVVVTLGPLPPSALGALLSRRLGLELTPGEVDRMHAQTGGNPFWALQTGAEVRAGGLHDPIPVPHSLAEAVGARLRRLGDDAQTVLTVVAALAGGSLPTVLDALSGQLADPARAVDDAVRAGAVVEAAGALHPAHPLLGSAALAALPPARRRDLHLRLADLVGDIERRARHLVAASAGSGPDEQVASVLEAASAAVRRRGAISSAAQLAEWAANFTPRNSPACLGRRRLDAAALYYATGANHRALLLLKDLDSAGYEFADWARAHRLLVDLTFLQEGRRQAVAAAEHALAEAGEDLNRRVVALALTIDMAAGVEPLLAQERAREAMRYAELTDGDHPVLAEALVSMVNAGVDTGDGVATDLLDRAAKLESGLAWTSVPDRVVAHRGYLLKSVERLDESRSALAQSLRLALDEGEDGSLAFLYAHLAVTELWAGNYPEAERCLAEADRALGPGGQASLVQYALRPLLSALTGELDRAERELDREHPPGGLADARVQLFACHVRGVIALQRDDPQLAVEVLGRAYHLAGQLGIREPGRRRRLDGEYGQALVQTGDLPAARQVAAQLQEMGRTQGRDTLTGIGLRIDGLAAAAEGSLDEAERCLTEAVARHERSPLRLEWGLSQLALGQVRRRQRARGPAREALDLAIARFTEMGAAGYLAQARREREAAGASPRPGNTPLTATEQRVAELVASGLSNRETAGLLFTSVRTVEGHLSAVYRKLGVRTRSQLTVRLHESGGE
ncbi:AAA family ATPase [Krasilnikovia sp. MM14-A1004]|uniref:AAA family ATPase n=1 Tax=Krasilnikovia sp. MM14-A1004 TaxID=3373541 RepID=UPI00399D4B94